MQIAKQDAVENVTLEPESSSPTTPSGQNIISDDGVGYRQERAISCLKKMVLLR